MAGQGDAGSPDRVFYSASAVQHARLTRNRLAKARQRLQLKWSTRRAVWDHFQEQRFALTMRWAAYQRKRRLAGLSPIPWMPPDQPVYRLRAGPGEIPRVITCRVIAGGQETFFRCVLEHRNGVVCLVIGGEIDLSNAPTFRSYLDKAVRGAGDIILHMQQLRYVDSSGVNTLLDAHVSLSRENRRMVLVGASPMVRRILSVLSIEKVMPLFSTLEDALSYLRAPSRKEQASGET